MKELIARCSIQGVLEAKKITVLVEESEGGTCIAQTKTPCKKCRLSKGKKRYLLVKEDPNDSPLEVVMCGNKSDIVKEYN